MSYYIQIKDEQIPVVVRNYRNSNTIKLFFKGSTLNISKPIRLKNEKIHQMIQNYQEELYREYKKILLVEEKNKKHWINGEEILYRGEKFLIQRQITSNKEIRIAIEEDNKKIQIFIPSCKIEERQIKEGIDKKIKQLFKTNTITILKERLPYWSKITKICYQSFQVRDAVSKFGSCKPVTRELYFSARLIMLPKDKIDAVIVHELCHIIYKNHSSNFYNLVKQYIPNYDEISQWLKKNSKEILF